MDAKRILVVDDDIDIQIALRARLRANGYEVEIVDDGEKALLAITGQVPDLVVLDIRLPGKDGFEILQHFKRDPAFAEIPVVMLSAQDPHASEQRALQGGATAYCRKPFVSSELLDTIADALECRTR